VEKVSKYELMFIRFTWIFIMVFVAHIVVCDIGMQSGQNTYPGTVIKLSFFLLIPLVNIAKYFLVRNNLFFRKKVYHTVRLVEVPLILSVIVFPDRGMGYVMLMFLILVTSFYAEKKFSFAMVGYAFCGILF